MIDGKFIATLFAVIMAIIAICNSQKVYSLEGFGMLPSRTTKMSGEIVGKCGTSSNYGFIGSGEGFQANLSPRSTFNGTMPFSAKYNETAIGNQAVPKHPLTTEHFTNMVDDTYEGFCSSGCGNGCSQVDCSNGGCTKYSGPNVGVGPNFSAGNYKETVEDAIASSGGPEITNLIPASDMTVVGEDGNTENRITYDRLIVANRNSTLRRLGDKIRGDLPIVPCTGEWFRPSVAPNIDLEQGAMSVIGGADNATAQQMAELLYATAGNTTTVGIDQTTSVESNLYNTEGITTMVFP